MINKNKIIDLTQTMYEGIADWDGCCGFQMRTVSDYAEGVCVQELMIPNGIGTHIDAPNHFIKDGLDISGLRLENLISPGVVINVTAKTDADYVISEEDIVNFELRYGVIPAESIVIAYTGWGKYWSQPDKYRNEDFQGIMHFPKFSIKAIELLLQRNISGIAIDTLSPDGSDYSFPVHQRLLSNNKFIIENIRVTDELPASGFTILALPLKIKSATEAPCRVIACL